MTRTLKQAAAILTLLLALPAAPAQSGTEPGEQAEAAPPKRGLLRNEIGAFQGYTLFAPLKSKSTYLIDMEGRVVHEWVSEHRPGNSAYLLDDGRLLRAARDSGDAPFRGGGIGGRVQILDWDSNVLWDYSFASDEYCHHHDIEPLPNGNVLMVAWENRTKEEAIAAGCDPEKLGDELWPDFVVEVKPDGKTGGQIVWEWRVWDHLVQDFDRTKANYGVVANHPELIDVNYDRNVTRLPPAELARLEALGYVGGAEPEEEEDEEEDERRADWLHTNAIHYNAELDQIVLSVIGFNELWVIDHSMTTEEAAGHSGGRYGKGGDLLYRWGNPQAYYAGRERDQRLFAQHDVRWITGEPKTNGRFLVFNNGRGRPDGEDDEAYSSVDEIVPPINSRGAYELEAGKAFAPADPVWRYVNDPKPEFYSGHISGAHRLPNGNTFICSGEKGRFFEVTRSGEIVWEYLNPFGQVDDNDGKRGDGDVRRPPPRQWPRGEVPAARPGAEDPPQRGRGRPPPDDHDPEGKPKRKRGPGDPLAVFRATRLAPDHPGLRGRELQPRE